jgi:hypothetical protein
MKNRRTGKIARLPEEVRNQVNELLTDGVDYPHIIDYLAAQGFSDVIPANLTNWRNGGYEDWLNHQQRLEELELKAAYALDLAHGADAHKFQQAALNLSTLQFFELLNRFDSVTLTKALHERPDKFPTVINALAKLTREIVGLERFRAAQHDQAKREAERNPENLGGVRTETVQKMLAVLRIQYPKEFALAAQEPAASPDSV